MKEVVENRLYKYLNFILSFSLLEKGQKILIDDGEEFIVQDYYKYNDKDIKKAFNLFIKLKRKNEILVINLLDKNENLTVLVIFRNKNKGEKMDVLLFDADKVVYNGYERDFVEIIDEIKKIKTDDFVQNIIDLVQVNYN